MHTGHCQCGGVRFRIRGELAAIQLCHCSQCRRAQGTPFASNLPVAEDAFELTGAQLLRSFESSPGKHRFFCSRCGSPIFSRTEAKPGVLRVRAGLINEPLAARPGMHIYVGSAASWWTVGDDLPRFEAGVVQSERTAAD